MSASHTWPVFQDGTSSTSESQIMIAYLLKNKEAYAKLSLYVQRQLTGLGIEVTQCREESMGLSMRQLGQTIDLASGFIALLEAGRIMPNDLTGSVWDCIDRIEGFTFSEGFRTLRYQTLSDP